MEKFKNVLVPALIAVLVVVAGHLFFPSTETIREIVKEVGATAGTDHYNPERFTTFTQGGGVTTRQYEMNAGTYTLTSADVTTSNVLRLLPTKATTVTLPTSAVLGLVTTGESRDFIITNEATSTFALTFVGGANTLLKVASSTNSNGSATTAVLLQGGMGRLTLSIATTTASMVALFTPLQ